MKPLTVLVPQRTDRGIREYGLVRRDDVHAGFPITRFDARAADGAFASWLERWLVEADTAVTVGHINGVTSVLAVTAQADAADATWADAREVNRLIALGRVNDSLTLSAWAMVQAQSRR
ncbi:hypothetical protein [Microbacterium sp. 77mftsu3.1]|uniref:hypothetical protein n=1 Tax=Microbacterium sp. 77mftsu3.1 TaxID=1761802 RepID=UPI00037F4356|nr:hypothetical protein [Microbacterium sp. 77mftsu3.1]SDH48048.1 hypothetical protein SAMN04488590_3400 [Microbacterium sp. 77mftsu3.1]